MDEAEGFEGGGKARHGGEASRWLGGTGRQGGGGAPGHGDVLIFSPAFWQEEGDDRGAPGGLGLQGATGKLFFSSILSVLLFLTFVLFVLSPTNSKKIAKQLSGVTWNISNPM